MADVVAILFYGRCFCHCFVFLADVIAIFLLADVIAIVFGFVADVVATVAVVFATCVEYCILCGRCYCHPLLADVIAIFVAVFVTDVMATMADNRWQIIRLFKLFK